MEQSTPPRQAITLAQLSRFDEIIDARSPAEFAEDHIPGAINLPVLSNEERARVGTLYKQESPFAAKKLGAALVARNIANHLEQYCIDKPRTWRPLVYCWRGGSRSGAMVHIFSKVGWRAEQLDGGYKAYRRSVLAALETLPALYRYRVVCGLTGSGKSRLLTALKQQGAQVLDLEQLAAHRGSLLGSLPDAPQPPQKLFESRLWAELQKLDPSQPVYIESESKKIGNVRLPDALMENMWQGRCIRIEATQQVRVAFLKEEYIHFLQNPSALTAKLEFLTSLYGKETVSHWQQLASQHEWDLLVGELLQRHYDPAYSRSMLKHYPRYEEGLMLQTDDLGNTRLNELATRAIAWP